MVKHAVQKKDFSQSIQWGDFKVRASTGGTPQLPLKSTPVLPYHGSTGVDLPCLCAVWTSMTQNVTLLAGVILIPKGSQIEGQPQPAKEGSRFITKELVTRDGRGMAIAATH